ncbi:6-phosphofructokinase [Tautonia plasticadhaerens]|uniref:ATP-dependent 6-phosphofructokinase n=1 Tax=Tautonia plasticadhaerens TaxID=2527974 RepID=A0A518GUI8_9BACT|nr:ATP-dependent 6-phosphofructokinase [Tautonia plasticadhaerens]QDV32253.1 Pyrophosphate--fructose 6-phosphate 1-phosphotransferase [Tautonia plasticadhaerens]
MATAAAAPIRRIGISTGGGDAPGLNAVIRAAVVSALRRGWEVVGIRDGFDGVLVPDRFHDGGLMPLTLDRVRGITHLGGTILGTTNKNNPLRYPVARPDGSVEPVDRTPELAERLLENIDALIAIGGDGSMEIAHALSRRGVRVVGVPKTIDNDLDGTVVTFGFATAVAFATECIDRLHSTAEAHQRVMVVEVMGRYAGWIALHCGIAGSADVILMPEIPFDLEPVARKVEARGRLGRPFTMVVVAEGARPKGGEVSLVPGEPGRVERLGGMGEKVAEGIRAATGRDVRTVVLGHLLRGGTPEPSDRLLALRFGAAAVRALATDHTGVMVALDPPDVKYVPLDVATHRMKSVPLDCDTMLTGRDLGICFGD